MLNCLFDLKFSDNISKKRIEKAYKTLGINVVKRMLGFTLFILGAKRNDVAQHLNIPLGTFFSFLTRIDQYGLFAFEDMRKVPSLHVKKIEGPLEISLGMDDQNVSIQLGRENRFLSIPRNNHLQCKVVLLTFLNSGLLSAKDIAQTLRLSERHIRELSAKMHDQDAYALIDKRKGQLIDYRFTPEIKAELIQQFVAHAITDKPTSSHVISEHLSRRCNLNLPDRSIRLHVKKLGLSEIKKSLPEIVQTLKKNFSSCS